MQRLGDSAEPLAQEAGVTLRDAQTTLRELTQATRTLAGSLQTLEQETVALVRRGDDALDIGTLGCAPPRRSCAAAPSALRVRWTGCRTHAPRCWGRANSSWGLERPADERHSPRAAPPPAGRGAALGAGRRSLGAGPRRLLPAARRRRAAERAAQPRIDKVLLVASAPGPGLYDSDRMVFSADGRSRSYFQFGYWSERPSQSLLWLAGHGWRDRGASARWPPAPRACAAICC